MKKTIIALLLISFVLASYCSSGSCGCNPGSCGCNPDGCCTADPSFPVNDPVCVTQPSYVTPPPCVIPQVPEACVCPPPVDKPDIEQPSIDVPEITPPPVVEPPSVTPPNIVIPPPPPPHICPPTPPPVPYPVPGEPTLPVIPLPPPPPPPVPTPTDPTLTRKFRLTFQYGCRAGVELSSCLANIIWNDRIIFSIVPTDYAVYTKTLYVYVEKGENKLQIEGAGTSDSLGLIVDNVRLVRVGTSVNIVVNGDFEQPNVGNSWSLFNNIPGWSGVGIEVGDKDLYGSIGNNQVIELDGNKNYIITQVWFFDSDYKLSSGLSSNQNSFFGQSLTYRLHFDYAARTTNFNNIFSSQCVVVWNNVVVGTIIPSNGLVKHKHIYVKLRPGKNTLHFDASSLSDSYGLTIDNVRLDSVLDSTNLIVNGKFENPFVGGVNQYQFFNGGIPGWEVFKAEVGHAKTVYNSNWPYSTQQCAELDSDSNQRYTQVINIPECKYASLLTTYKTHVGDAAVQDKLYEAQQAANVKIQGAVAQIKGHVYQQIHIIKHKFEHYLCKLYKIVKAEVKDLKQDQLIALSQFDCLSKAYIGHYGTSYQTDFDSGYFSVTNLGNWEGYIQEVHGKILKCIDLSGKCHYLQIAPCSHFEGQFPLPIIGHKIYWQGSYSPDGRKTYVKYATTCNC